MGRLPARLWAGLPKIAVGLFCLLSVAPGFASKSFPTYHLRWGWVAWALVAGFACLFGAVRIDCRRCRLTAAGLAATYIFARAVYSRWQFPQLSPWSQFFLAVALATCIAWSWGRPPIIGRHIESFPRRSDAR